jgi:hypothetical protein
MKEYDTIACFCCDKVMENMHYESRLNDSYVYVHPIDGLHFQTRGHYGSTMFDPMDGSSLDIAICDDCIKQRAERIRGTGKTNERFG